MDDVFKLVRLYCGYSEIPLQSQQSLHLNEGQSHYLRNVMRRNEGDHLRVFNGSDGEYLAEIQSLSKKSCKIVLLECLKEQKSENNGKTALIFAPLAKNRMDFVIEKGVELGVTDFYPVLTHRTEHRQLKDARLNAQIIEAAEQSERLTLPILHALTPLEKLVAGWDQSPCIQWGCERNQVQRQPLGACTDTDQAFLIGPVGGFDAQEVAYLSAQPCVQPIHLGAAILRAETASLFCLAARQLQQIEK